MAGAEISEHTFDLASLPLSLGGLGLQSAQRVRHAAYWASWSDSLAMVEQRHPDVARVTVRSLQGRGTGIHLDGVIRGSPCSPPSPWMISWTVMIMKHVNLTVQGEREKYRDKDEVNKAKIEKAPLQYDAKHLQSRGSKNRCSLSKKSKQMVWPSGRNNHREHRFNGSCHQEQGNRGREHQLGMFQFEISVLPKDIANNCRMKSTHGTGIHAAVSQVQQTAHQQQRQQQQFRTTFETLRVKRICIERDVDQDLLEEGFHGKEHHGPTMSGRSWSDEVLAEQRCSSKCNYSHIPMTRNQELSLDTDTKRVQKQCC